MQPRFIEKIPSPSVWTIKIIAASLTLLFGVQLLLDFIRFVLDMPIEADTRGSVILTLIGIFTLVALRHWHGEVKIESGHISIIDKGVAAAITETILISDVIDCKPVTYMMRFVWPERRLLDDKIEIIDEQDQHTSVPIDQVWLPIWPKKWQRGGHLNVKRQGVLMELASTKKKMLLQTSKAKEFCEALRLEKSA